MCEQNNIYRQIAKLSEWWMRRCGSTLQMRNRLRMIDAAIERSGMTPEQRVLLAAACDLYDILAATPEGRQALTELGCQPFSQDSKGE